MRLDGIQTINGTLSIEADAGFASVSFKKATAIRHLVVKDARGLDTLSLPSLREVADWDMSGAAQLARLDATLVSQIHERLVLKDLPRLTDVQFSAAEAAQMNAPFDQLPGGPGKGPLRITLSNVSQQLAYAVFSNQLNNLCQVDFSDSSSVNVIDYNLLNALNVSIKGNGNLTVNLLNFAIVGMDMLSLSGVREIIEVLPGHTLQEQTQPLWIRNVKIANNSAMENLILPFQVGTSLEIVNNPQLQQISSLNASLPSSLRRAETASIRIENNPKLNLKATGLFEPDQPNSRYSTKFAWFTLQYSNATFEGNFDNEFL